MSAALTRLEVSPRPGDNPRAMSTPPAPKPPKPESLEPDPVTEALPAVPLVARTPPDAEPKSVALESLLEPARAADDEDLPTETLSLSALLSASRLLADKAGRPAPRGNDLPFDSPRLAPPAVEPPGRDPAAEAASPYPGLAAFTEADADRFFGRRREIRELVAGLRELPLRAIVGASGSGKTSLVLAGLVPALLRSGERWEVIRLNPGRAPMAALAAALSPLAEEKPGAKGASGAPPLAELLRSQPGRAVALLGERARREEQKVLLFVDAFEELYALASDAAEREAFVACLAGAAGAGDSVRILVALRSDFALHLEGEALAAAVEKGRFELADPAEADLREALVQPALGAGVRFESAAVVEDLMRQLSKAKGALPLLQLAAAHLWAHRSRERQLLTEASWAEVGGLAGVLARHADAAMSELSPPRRARVRAVLLCLVGANRAPVAATAKELSEVSRSGFELGRALDALVRARLLVAQSEGGEPRVELAHECLIRSWPALRKWLDEGGEAAVFRERLRDAARQWEASGEDTRLLWRRQEAEQAGRLPESARAELPQVQQQFLEAVAANLSIWKRRRRVLARSGFIALAVFSALASAGAWRAQKDALLQVEAARRSEAMALSAEAEAARRLAMSRAQPTADRLAEKRRELADLMAKLDSKAAGTEAQQAARAQAAKVAAELEELLARERGRVHRVRVELGAAAEGSGR